MPGPISDSIDPEFGTGANAGDIVEIIDIIRDRLGACLGERKKIVQVVHGECGPETMWNFCERDLRVIRFCLERAKESI